jgi:N-acyl homoserine lactone hydrolase
MRRHMFRPLMPTFAAVLFFAVVASPAQDRTEPLRALKLYVFDCGTIHVANTEVFGLKKEEVATSDLAVPCFLVVHSKETLVWDVGAVPDVDWKPMVLPLHAISACQTTGNET